jgi:putative ABC transport system permease protein
MLGSLALGVLLLAIFNYINLTLARSLSRSREVGVRKVIGAQRGQLVNQFIVEAVIGVSLSLVLAFGIFQYFKRLAVVQRLVGDVPWDLSLWLICIGFSGVVGLLAGIIPARALSAFEPVQALKSQTSLRSLQGLTLQKVLTVAQFSASLIAMIFNLVLYRQTTYMATAAYGFDREQILNISLYGDPQQKRLLTQAFAGQAGVERISASSALLGMRTPQQPVRRESLTGDQQEIGVAVYHLAVDTNFVRNMGLTLVAGHNIQVSRADPGQVLINEHAVKAFRLGTPQQALGQALWLNDSTQTRVAGVLKDFRFQPFLFPIGPLLLRYHPEHFNYLNVKVTAGATKNILPELERRWKQVIPYQPFQAEWFDQQLKEQNLQHQDQLFIGALTAMAMVIACLGLLGMVMYGTQARTKEIGIRKVMGANVHQLVRLLSRDFIILLGVAAAIGLPAGYQVGYLFLQQYAYHITIGAGILISCFCAILFLGGLAIGTQTIKAAMADPVKSLRQD